MKNWSLVVPLLLGLLYAGDDLPQSTEADTTAEAIDSIGFVGIYITETDTGEGVKVDDIIPNSPAAVSGIKKGDIIIEFNDKRVSDPEFLFGEIAKTKPGEKVLFKIRRKGKIINITVKTTVRPKEQKTPAASGGLINKIEKTIRSDKNYLGIKTCDIVPGLDEYFGTEEGVLIIEVIKGGFADRVGLKPGDVILGIDETDTPDIKTLKDVIRKKEPGMKLTINLIRHKRRFTISGIL